MLRPRYVAKNAFYRGNIVDSLSGEENPLYKATVQWENLSQVTVHAPVRLFFTDVFHEVIS